MGLPADTFKSKEKELKRGCWKKKGVIFRRCIICKKEYKAFNYTRKPRGKRLFEENIRPINCLTCSKKCAKIKLDLEGHLKKFLIEKWRKKFKKQLADLKERLKELNNSDWRCPHCCDAGCDDPVEHNNLMIEKAFAEELKNGKI